ncbi:hypothetical protein D6745_01960 [Candidatus Woesearchaeota archaeon]|nr:MAG: hypothetical protein D6745_01960 [Candidatus Woesearchaeota archaeon]
MSEMSEKEVMHKVEEEGYIYIKTIIEVLGKPKEHVAETLKLVVQKAKENDKLIFVKEKSFEPKPQEKLFSAFTEMELLVKNADALMDFCVEFMPSSVEILEPPMLDFKNTALSNLLNEFLGRLHKADMISKGYNAANQLLRKNIKTLVKNIILVTLKYKPMPLKELTRMVGIDEKTLKPFVDELIKNKTIILDDNKYRLAK